MLERAAVLRGAAGTPEDEHEEAVDPKVMVPKEDSGLGSAARAERGAGPYLDAVWRMVGALLLGAALGVFLDRKLGWEPWGVVSGLGLGLVLGFWSLMRSLSKLGKRA